MTEFIIAEKKDKIGVVTLNRPDAMNALCAGLIVELAEALDAFEADDDICVMINGSDAPHEFTLRGDRRWCRVIDTAGDPPDDIQPPGKEVALAGEGIRLEPRSVVVLVAR